jgi:CheY-like chemotaxis protein
MGDVSRPAILIVEDEALIRMDAADTIADSGFPTFEAGSADEALSLMERHDDILVLFTDIEMPGSMNGLALAARVRERWPQVRIIIASGAVEVKRADLPCHALFFKKPYDIGKVTDALHAMADGME